MRVSFFWGTQVVLLASFCRIEVGGGICARPGDIGCGSVCRRHLCIQQAQTHGQLRSMMGRMKHSAPKNPDPLPSNIEEGCFLKPEFLSGGSDLRKPPLGKSDTLVDVGLGGGRLPFREQIFDGRLGEA